MVTEYIMSTVEYIEKNLGVEAIGAIVIIVLIITAILGVVFLLFRGLRLWYWRVNDQVAALEKINRNLEELNQAMPNITVPFVRNENDEHSDAVNVEPSLEAMAEEQADGISLPQNVKEDFFVCEPKKEGYNVGKTGKIYSENELRQQIQF